MGIEDLFNKLQMYLGRVKKELKTGKELGCGRTLCAGASKGPNNYYHFHHCSSKCGYRLKAEEVNAEFEAFLKLTI